MAGTDQEIIERVLAGDKGAFASLVDRHKDRAMTLALRMLRNREEAEEAVQDAFVRAFRALGSFEWRSSFPTWFYRIVFNVCSTALSRKGSDRLQLVEDEDGSLAAEAIDQDPLPDKQYESEEFRRVLAEEIEKLAPPYSGVVTLFFVQELSYEEIAAVTGLPLGTVKVRLFRARALLRRGLQARFQIRGDAGRTMAKTAVM